jgi:hypothetical protein
MRPLVRGVNIPLMTVVKFRIIVIRSKVNKILTKWCC